jgi:hypothetical protein
MRRTCGGLAPHASRSKYFANLVRNFGEMVDVREVWLEGKAHGGELKLMFRNDMHIYYAAADTDYNALGPNTYMYFDHLRWAGANGLKTFDFGRCKRGYRGLRIQASLEYDDARAAVRAGADSPQGAPQFQSGQSKIRLGNPVMRLCWCLLWITRLIGPKLIRLFP